MTAQHVVFFGDQVRLTRLPPGRAEGLVWLTFIGVGEGLDIAIDHELTWHLREHLDVTWPGGSAAEIVSTGASGGDRMQQFHVVLRDTGEDRLSLAYLEEGAALSSETVELPVVPGS